MDSLSKHSKLVLPLLTVCGVLDAWGFNYERLNSAIKWSCNVTPSKHKNILKSTNPLPQGLL